MSNIVRIVIHCTATPEGKDYTREQILDWFRLPPPRGKGWKYPGYHMVVHLNGSLETLLPIPEDGILRNGSMANGAKGYNSNSIHIAYIGGVMSDGHTPKDTRTRAQRSALQNVVIACRGKYGPLPVYGHRDLPGVNKACPSFDARKEFNHD